VQIDLKCFANLVNPDTCDYKHSSTYDLTDGKTVDDLIDRAGIARKDVKIAFVDSQIVDFDTVLCDGDRVGLAPAVGGM
jgi:molybdopterin converting factor small subunit